jgi:hypothetical protein
MSELKTAAKEIREAVRLLHIDIREAIAVYELLEAGNTDEIAAAVSNSYLEPACGLLQRAMIERLVMTLMKMYDSPNGTGDKITLGRVFRLLALPEAAKAVTVFTDGASRLEQARARWGELRQTAAAKTLRDYRNRVLAHTIPWTDGTPKPFYIHMQDLLSGSIKIVELLADGVGVVRVPLKPDSIEWQKISASFWTKITSFPAA